MGLGDRIRDLKNMALAKGGGIKFWFKFGGASDDKKRREKMKKKKKTWGFKLFAIAFLFAAAMPAKAGIMDIARKYQVTLPTELVSEVKGRRDVTNADYKAGYGVDVLWFKRRDQVQPIFYLAIDHLFNYNQKGRGSIGASFGVGTGKAGVVADKVFAILIPSQAHRLKWFGKLANFVSIEGGLGYNVGTIEEGDKRLHWGYGGKLRVPVDKFLALFKGKKKE